MTTQLPPEKRGNNAPLWSWLAPGLIALVALFVAFYALGAAGSVPGANIQTQGVTNLDSLHLSDTGGTATPVFIANQNGTGVIAEFQDGGTPVAQWVDGGGMLASAGVDLNGQNLTIDTDGDSILAEASDDNLTLTLGGATGTFSVRTGNLTVGNGSPSTAQDGEDAYVEGGFEVDGTARFDGAISANSTVTIGSGGDAVSELAFGVASTVVSGTTIAHGMSSTPTLVLLTPQAATAYTPTVSIMAIDATNITVGTSDAITITALHWQALR